LLSSFAFNFILRPYSQDVVGTPAGRWLTTQLAAAHRWGLTATPGGDKLHDIASLLFGQKLTRRAFRRVRAR